MMKYIVPIVIVILCYALSWSIAIGLMYLICLCFSWQFNLLIATGVWLIMCLVSLALPRRK